LGAYTWSKSLDNSSGFGERINPFDYRVSRALSAFDMSHNFVLSYNYDLPFQRMVHSTSGAARKFLEGWSISGITRFTTGLPIGMSYNVDNSLCSCGGAVDRPNYNGQPIQYSDPRSSDNHQYFSTAQFSDELLGVAGNSSRRFFHGPGLNNWDFAIHKNTAI